MKVLKNNYEGHKETNTKEAKLYPRAHICESCGSELEYDKSDLIIGEFGCCFLNCPCCNYDNLIENEEFILTKNNIEFPTHFNHCSEENGAVNCCTNEKINECINKAIDYFRNNKDEFAWIYETGNLHMTVFRYNGDGDYYVIVSNDYYNTYIQFEDEDY